VKRKEEVRAAALKAKAEKVDKAQRKEQDAKAEEKEAEKQKAEAKQKSDEKKEKRETVREQTAKEEEKKREHLQKEAASKEAKAREKAKEANVKDEASIEMKSRVAAGLELATCFTKHMKEHCSLEVTVGRNSSSLAMKRLTGTIKLALRQRALQSQRARLGETLSSVALEDVKTLDTENEAVVSRGINLKEPSSANEVLLLHPSLQVVQEQVMKCYTVCSMAQCEMLIPMCLLHKP